MFVTSHNEFVMESLLLLKARTQFTAAVRKLRIWPVCLFHLLARLVPCCVPIIHSPVVGGTQVLHIYWVRATQVQLLLGDNFAHLFGLGHFKANAFVVQPIEVPVT